MVAKKQQRQQPVPVNADLRLVPRWACVAFAARCARRSQPIFAAAWPDAPPEHVEAIESAISQAEECARSASADASVAASASYAAVAANANAYAAANAAAYAAYACVAADASDAASDAAADSARAIARFAIDERVARRLIWADYDALVTMAREKHWTDDSPVDVAWLGPLWPDGEPKWFTRAMAASKASEAKESAENFASDDAIILAIDLGDATVDEGREVLRALNEYHIAAGGLGLEFTVDGNYVLVRAAVCP